MKIKDILESEDWITVGQREYRKKIIPNPFPNSKINSEMYHGSRSTMPITKFNRPPEGVWFAEFPEWSERYYGKVYCCYLNVKNPYYPTDDENDEYYGEMDKIGVFFNKLQKEGYDAYIQGGESGSVAVFDTVEIVNALTGERL